MLKKSKVLSLFIVLSMVLPIVTPIGEIANAASINDVQTFSLPIIEEESELLDKEPLELLSTEESETVKEYNFKEDIVKVYFNTDIKYPIFGKVPVVIKLTAEKYETLQYVSYNVVLKNGEEEIVSDDLRFEEKSEWDGEKNVEAKYVLAFFPEAKPGDYEISLEVSDEGDYWSNSVEVEEVEVLEVPVEEIVVEKQEETPAEELEEKGKEEEQEENIIEEPEEVEEPKKEEAIEEPIEELDEPSVELVEETEEIEGQEISKEEIVEGTKETEDVEEKVIPEESEIETEEVTETEKLIESEVKEEETVVLEESTANSFKTDFVQITLSYEDIIEEDELILDASEIYLNFENVASEGRIEARITDEKGNTVYTTSSVFGDDGYSYQREYYIDPFYDTGCFVYCGHVSLYKSNEASEGEHNFILEVDGEEIYTKVIKLVNKHPIVNYVNVEKYVLSGDREFELEVNGDYLTKKDDIELKVVDEKGNTVANSVDSDYKSYSNSGHTQILYTMKVVDGRELVDKENYKVELKYIGADEFEMKAEHVTISTTTSPIVVKADRSLANMGLLLLEGANLSEDDEYFVEIERNGMNIGEFEAEFNNSSTLTVNLGESLKTGEYNITVWRVYNYGYSYGRNSIGYVLFYYRPEIIPEKPTGDPVLWNTYPMFITQNTTSYGGEIIVKNFDFNFDSVEITLVNKDGNVVGDGEYDGIYMEKNGEVAIEFYMNISEMLNLNEEYCYIFKCDGKEIKTVTGERLKVKVTDELRINDVYIYNAIDRYDSNYQIIGIDKDIEFELSGMNIKDLSKLDVYIRDTNGNKVAELIQNSLKKLESADINEIYSGKMKIEADKVKSGVHEIIVAYDGEELYFDKIEITTEVYVDDIYSENIISTNDKNYDIELYRVLNIDKDKLKVEIFDLLGNKLDTHINSINDYGGDGEYSDRTINILLDIDEPLKDSFYELRVYHDSDDLMKYDTYGRRIYATGKPSLIGSSWYGRFNNDDVNMNLTRLSPTVNVDPSEKYTGYFYLREDERYNNNQKYVGTTELSIGEWNDGIGIIYPPIEFINYPIGSYNVYIVDSDGELFGRSHFEIRYKHGNIINPDEPDEKDPIFVINNGSKYLNNDEITLNINPASYTLIKIANTKEELKTMEPIAVKKQMKWTLPQGDGEKVVYVQFLDDEGNSSQVLTQTVILDTTAPKLIDASVNPTENFDIGEDIYIEASSNEKVKAYAVFYKDEEEIKISQLGDNGKDKDKDVYRYSSWIDVDAEFDIIKVYAQDLAGNKSEEKIFDIKMGKFGELSGTLFKGYDPSRMLVPNHNVDLWRKVDGNYEWYKWTTSDIYGYFRFDTIPTGEYKLVSTGMKGYKDIEKEIYVCEDYNHEELVFEPLFGINKSLTIVVQDKSGQSVNGVGVSIYGYKAYKNESKTTNDNGIALFENLPAGEDIQYDIYVYADGYNENRTITLTDDAKEVFTIPNSKTLSGKVTCGEVEKPVEGAEIRLIGGGQYYVTTTDENGEYTITIKDDIEYTLTIEHPLYKASEQKIGNEIKEYNIKMYEKVKVFGTLSDELGNSLPNIDIYASSNDDWQRVTTNDKGEYELRLGYGNYTISHGWVEGYMDKYDDIKIEEGTSSLEHNITLEPYDYDNSFSGDGNNVKADVKTIQRGKTFNLVVNYKNNGPKVDSGKVSVDLPEGLELVGGNTEKSITNLKRGQSGQLLMTVKVLEEYKGNKIIIPGKVTIEDKEYAIGFAEIDVIDVTLTAPELVPDGNFKVYGEATLGANVAIIDKDTNKVLANSKVIGRWYSVDIKDLAEGKHEIFAKAEKDGQVAISEIVNVEVDPMNGVSVDNIEIITPGGQKIGMNPEIGVPAFTAWTGINLDGRNIDINVKLSKNVDSVKFIFAGKEYNATKDENDRWSATFSDWSATGTQQIFMEITIGDRTVELIVGEVIILIDPSGYVYDTYTGERIEGARVTCEVWEGNEWKIWDAEIYGQINPQITDEEGNYGWMVPEGKYRVRVDKEGYKSNIVGSDYSIIIPPPRTDVNIGLTSLTETYDEVVRTGFYLNQTRGKKFIDIYNFLNQNKEYRDAITTAGLENVLFVHQSGQGAKLIDILYGDSFRPLKPEDFASGYKDVTTGGTIRPTLGLHLLSFEVEDDMISVWFEGIPVEGEPTKEDFTVIRKINDAEETVNINSIEWNFETRKAVLNIDKYELAEGQTLEYIVKYKGK